MVETQMIAFDLLRTQKFEYRGTNYTIRLNRNISDNQDNLFIVKNEKLEKFKTYHFAESTAAAFFQYRGGSIFNVIPEIIKDDIESGIV
jgi:hypothetical protein